MKQTLKILRYADKIDPVSVKDYVKVGGYEALRKAVENPDKIIDTMKASGLRGRGGAGFGVGQKWSFVKNTKADVKYVVCNADEGEPGTNKDRVIIEKVPHLMLEGMAISGVAVGSTKAYIYLRAEYVYLRENLEKAIAEAKAQGYLGKKIMGSKYDFDIEVRLGAGAYVCGEETAMLESIEGKRGEPRYKPPYPGVEGLWQKPTIINNVETFVNVPLIIKDGVEEFRKYGSKNNPGTKLYTLSGNIKNPGVYEFPIGITIRELFEKVGGGCPNGKKLKAIQTGGASGNIIPPSLLDTPFDIDPCNAVGATFGAGDLMFIDEDQDIIDVVENLTEFFDEESCGQCTPCREGNRRLLELIRKFKDGTAVLEDLELMEELSEVMCDTSLCGLGQASAKPLQSVIRFFRPEFTKNMKGGHQS
ncbi:MAG: NADH-quinone oxidoreductase subunit NuoF [Bacilli bacterium]|jgi:NADH:ubiquinone oxidoreductase subunit F (NADH-binding)